MYADRLCAFIDILGFRQLVAQLGGDEAKVQALRDSLKRVHNAKLSDVPTLNDRTDYRTQSISDAVAISAQPTLAGLILIMRAVELLSTDLLALGYFVRGAIIKGPLYHDETIIFGEALIRAYDLETTVVRYPRIMLTRGVLSLLDVSEPKEPASKLIDACKGYVRNSADGPRYIHVLRKMETNLTRAVVDPGKIDEATRLQYQGWKEKIEQRFEEELVIGEDRGVDEREGNRERKDADEKEHAAELDPKDSGGTVSEGGKSRTCCEKPRSVPAGRRRGKRITPTSDEALAAALGFHLVPALRGLFLGAHPEVVYWCTG